MIAIDWARRELTLNLLAADKCGISLQPWHRECVEHDGEAGRELVNFTIALDDLQVPLEGS